MDELHHEGLATVEIAEVGDGLRRAHSSNPRRSKHIELLSKRQRVEMDHSATGATEDQLPPVGRVHLPGLLRGATRQLHHSRNGGTELLCQRLVHSSFTASLNP